MFKTADAFFEEAQPIIDQFNQWAEQHKPELLPDHLGYKCASSREFEHIRRLLEVDGFFLYQSFISGRRIAIIKLEQPLQTHLGSIGFLELADQKPDDSQTSGFDHIELYPSHIPLEQLVVRLNTQGTRFRRVARKHHMTFDLELVDGFKIRLEPEPLIEKIKHDEMR